MRKRLIIGAVMLAAGVGGAGRHPAGGATTKKKRVDRITCEEFVALDPDDQQRIAYWIDGYQVAKGAAAVGTVAFDKCRQPIDALVEDCTASPNEMLWQKLKRHP